MRGVSLSVEEGEQVCVIGPRDVEAGAVSVRTYRDGELGQLAKQEVMDRLVSANKDRTQF